MIELDEILEITEILRNERKTLIVDDITCRILVLVKSIEVEASKRESRAK